MSERDICELLQELANLKTGDMAPDWLYSDPDDASGSWASGMSKLLNEAVQEIKRLRRSQRPYSEDMGR